MFADDLKAKGWVEGSHTADYTKGEWQILFDTSSWIIVSTKDNPRVFDVHVPGEYESGWAVNLIEHLCQMEDERVRLRKALKSIGNMASAADMAHAAVEALERCHHSWLVNLDIPDGQMGRVYCPICGRIAVDDRG